MADQSPESWTALFQALEKYGFPMGVIVGAIGLGVAIKRGWLFIGDRTKLAVALAVAQKELEHERHLNEDLKKQLAEAQSLLVADIAPDTA